MCARDLARARRSMSSSWRAAGSEALNFIFVHAPTALRWRSCGLVLHAVELTTISASGRDGTSPRGAGFGSVVRVVRGLDVLVPILVDML